MKNSSPVSASATVDVCVVGGGVIGKAAALALAQAGQRVTLLIAGHALASASAKPAQPQGAAGWDARVYAVNQVAYDLLTSLKVWDALDADRVTAVDRHGRHRRRKK